jgi:hypothetical protein
MASMTPAAHPSVRFPRPVAPGPVDPGQQAIGLRPTTSSSIPHSVDTGPPVFTSAIGSGGPIQVTQVALVTPLFAVAQVVNGVAIFGTAGGRMVTP